MSNDILCGSKCRGSVFTCADTVHHATWRKCLLWIKMRRCKHWCDEGDVRWFKGIDERLLKNPPSARLRSGFEYGPKPRLRVTLANCSQGFFYRSRVVRKVVVDAHTVHFPPNFQPPLHALERRQPALDQIIGYTQFFSDDDDPESVLYVESAG